MKRIISILMSCILILCLASCAGEVGEAPEDTLNPGVSDSLSETDGAESTGEDGTAATTEAPDEPVSESEEAQIEPVTTVVEPSEPQEIPSGALVVYFSATGNTKSVAEKLAELQDADIYEIVPVEPYTSEDLNYSNRSSRSTSEQNDASARPAISGDLSGIENYDTIYIGYPIWWGDMPRILYTFFDACDLSGKTIAPFCTSGGSGLSGTPRSISGLEPDATVLSGLHINDSSLSSAESSISNWLSDIGLS